ncbi:MAG: hypothetical protein PHG03_00415 [Bacilli bacterium]|nr:hypothetical protein [Bacilli bacterium]MDD4795008.1 hypothetical protein [Bacilli bacterium]
MDNRTKIKLLSEIEDLIIELNGLDEYEIHKIGISMDEYENPTQETVQTLKNYIKQKQSDEKERMFYGR